MYRKQYGFTLVEALVGMIVSSMLIGATLSAYLAASGSWEKSRIRSQHYQHARMALQTIEHLISAAVDPSGKPSIDFMGECNTIEESGLDADRIKFVSIGSRVMLRRRDRIDLCEVDIYLNQNPDYPDQGLMMIRKTIPGDEFLEEKPKPQELAPNVISFNVDYYDGYEWLDEWTYASGLPRAVEVTITLADRHKTENPISLSKLIIIHTYKEMDYDIDIDEEDIS
jgi:type II secretion system protein J